MVEVGLDGGVEEDDDTVVLLEQQFSKVFLFVGVDLQPNAADPEHARSEIEPALIENVLVVPLHLESPLRSPRHVERQLVGYQDHLP